MTDDATDPSPDQSPDQSPDRPPDQPAGTDPDVDLRVPAQRDELSGGAGAVALVLGTIAAGGVLGAGLRAFLTAGDAGAVEHGGFPGLTLAVNVAGSVAIGVLMAVLGHPTHRHHRLLRPFLGVGVLGGFTTFSTYAVDAQRLLVDGHALVALVVLVGTPVLAVLGAWAGSTGARAVLL